MLGMAFFKSLVKQHGVQFFEPIGKALAAAGIKKPNLLNPAHAWALRKAIGPYAKWLLGEKLSGQPHAATCPPNAGRAAKRMPSSPPIGCNSSPLEIDGTMRKHQLALADRQCRMSDLSQRMQDAVTILHEPVRRPQQTTKSSAPPPTCCARI